MANGDKIDLSAAAQDQDFLRADMKDKIAYLSAHDKDFAAAHPQDQMDYVNFILGQGKPEEPSVGERLTSGYNPKLNEFAEKHPAANLLRPFDAAGGMVMGALPAAYQAFMHPIDTAVSTVADLASWMDPNTAKGAPSVLPEALGMGGLMAMSGEATGPAGKGLAKRAFTTPEGEATLPTKLILGKDRAGFLADYLNKEKVQAAKDAAELQRRRVAHSEMEEDFAKRKVEAAKDKTKSHEEFSKQLSDIENARQKELADWERFKEQHAQALMRRGRQSAFTSKATTPPQPPSQPSSGTSLLSRGRTLVVPGMEPDVNNPAHVKMINDYQTMKGEDTTLPDGTVQPGLRTLAKQGDRFAAFVLRHMPRPQ